MIKYFNFISAMTALLLCVGCCSFSVWKETGKITTHIEDIKAEFPRPDFLTVHFYGKQEKTWLPWIPDFSPEPLKQHITVPLKHYPDESVGEPGERTFCLEKPSEPGIYQSQPFRFYKTKCGLWSAPGSFSSDLHPDDIPHLYEPFIDSGTLFIPFQTEEVNTPVSKRKEMLVYGYTVQHAHFPLDGTVVEPMRGPGITILRWSLIPVPLVLDIALFPVWLTGYVLIAVPVMIFTDYGKCEADMFDLDNSAWWENKCIEPLKAEKRPGTERKAQ